MPDVVRLAGSPPSLPWPTAGSAALAIQGVGSLGHSGSSRPAPIASITKVMTAYVVLKDHPLVTGATGPDVPVDAATVAAYQAGLLTQQSEVQVTSGETLTEVEALEGLLIPSGNDIAVMLADWDAGSTTAFVAKMNAAAQSLGLDTTHFDDVSGLDPGSVSTPADLIRLGEAAMAIPAFAGVASMGEATLPVAGRVINFDYALGHDGIVGIKTGSDAAAGGCFLFQARRSVDGTMVSIVGAVMGQGTSSPITAALDAAENLAQAAFAAVTRDPVVPAGLLVGRIVAPWGASVDVSAAQPPTILAWPGLPRAGARGRRHVAAGHRPGLPHRRARGRSGRPGCRRGAPGVALPRWTIGDLAPDALIAPGGRRPGRRCTGPRRPSGLRPRRS